ncbi:DUF1028 domain-containing protein [Sediminicurvatus halobius]|uniref:DUF1028 domain-containing protein n=1 Tax=Sediminicurvatus halobius TaxID=2182432 RepID=A0A2U2MX20_9GAMM|nr:DUF1028 domain-containing protein [Spiribacter halobius]
MRQFAGTYSIVARCHRTGELGCAVASAIPAIGSICLFLHRGVGAACTQAWVNPYLALTTLRGMRDGSSAAVALNQALAEDWRSDHRQIGVIGVHGIATAWTGSSCPDWAGHTTRSDHAVQGNTLTGAVVLTAMSAAYSRGGDRPLDERLLRSLEAAQRTGGDKRGRQSAALQVMGAEDYPSIDLRVDDHPAPVTELRRIHSIVRAQLVPFMDTMPKRSRPHGAAPLGTTDLLWDSPPDRPRGGGSRTS